MTAGDRFVVAIDQGTTSTRCAVVDGDGRFAALERREHGRRTPRPGWVEHDAEEIWRNTQSVVAAAMSRAGITAPSVAAVGITNQRETTVAWDAATGEALAPAIVWQDTRTAELCSTLGGDAGPDRFRAATGVPLATYFSAPKMAWLIGNVPAVARSLQRGTLRLGTIDSWLVYRLTGRHVTDVTNAGRTMLMHLDTMRWDDGLLQAFGVPRTCLGDIVPSVGTAAVIDAGPLQGTPVAGILGDQQAALFGQGGFREGDIKCTYGTGCFMLMNTGVDRTASSHGMLETPAYQVAGEPAHYALEGSVAVAGAAVQWLRDNLGLIERSEDVEALAATVADNGDVYFVPAFSGLFAPYWRPDARGVLAGLTHHTAAGHVARAVLESVAYQTRDVLDAMESDAGAPISALRVDGGMVRNDLLMQFQADVLDRVVVRPRLIETTVLGAAMAAGLGVGFWSDRDDAGRIWEEERRFAPLMAASDRERLLAGWDKAVQRSLGWWEPS